MDRSRRRAVVHPYPRTARVNALLHEVLAEQVERLGDRDERLGMLTITGVSCDPDLRHAVVFFSSLPEASRDALDEHRKALQSALGSQVRLKRVPVLKFLPDPAIVAGSRVEAAIRRARGEDLDAPDT